MSLKIKNKYTEHEQIAAGTYVGACYLIADLGEQYNSNYKKMEEQVILVWELAGTEIEYKGEMKRKVISEKYNQSVKENSNLGKLINGFIGRTISKEEGAEGVDIVPLLLGQTGLVVVSETTGKNGKKYSHVSSFSRLVAGMQPLVLENDLVAFDISVPNQEMYDKLPEWIQKLINNSGKMPVEEEKIQANTGPVVSFNQSTGEVKQTPTAPIIPQPQTTAQPATKARLF